MATYGLMPVLGHHFALSFDPLLFGGLGTVAGSLPLFWAMKKAGRADVFSRRFAVPFAAIAAINGTATGLLFFGTRMTSGIHTGLLLQLEPLYSILLSVLLLGETVGWGEGLATALMMLGAGVVLYHPGAQWNKGELLIAAAPFFHQLSHVVTKKRLLGRVCETAVIPAARLLYSGLLLCAAASATAGPGSWTGFLSWKALAAVALFGFVFRGLDCWLWYEAIARVDLARASALIPLSVAVSFFGAVVLLGERPDGRQLAGLLLILASAAAFSRLGLEEPEPPGA